MSARGSARGLEDDWAITARDRHRERVIELLEEPLALAARDARHGPRDAIELTRRQVEQDRFGEDAHRRLIERTHSIAPAIAPARMLRIYPHVGGAPARRELGVAPSAQTRALSGSGCARRPPAHPVTGVPTAAPASLTLLGRERELAELEATWAAACAGSGAAAVIQGEAGIGKTRPGRRGAALEGARVRRIDRRIRCARPGRGGAAQPVGRVDPRAAAGARGARRRGGLAGLHRCPHVGAAPALRPRRRAERRDAARPPPHPVVRGGGGAAGCRRPASAGAACAR